MDGFTNLYKILKTYKKSTKDPNFEFCTLFVIQENWKYLLEFLKSSKNKNHTKPFRFRKKKTKTD